MLERPSSEEFSHAESERDKIVAGERGDLGFDYYLAAAEQNLRDTSRTAKGVIDTSASADKAGKMQEGLSESEIAKTAQRNFREAITMLFEQRNQQFANAGELRAFVEGIALLINRGVTKEGVLIRDGEDSKKYAYTSVARLEPAMVQFYDTLLEKVSNSDSDPVETAGFVEYRMNLTDHFFADGCGKTSKALSAWTLMRSNHALPTFQGLLEWQAALKMYGPRQQRGLDPTVDEEQFARWMEFYRARF